MNTATIYREATTPKAKKEEEKAKEAKALEDALFAEGLEKQGFDKWLQMKETQVLLEALNLAIINRHDQCVINALAEKTTQTTINSAQADALRKVILYARNKTPIY